MIPSECRTTSHSLFSLYFLFPYLFSLSLSFPFSLFPFPYFLLFPSPFRTTLAQTAKNPAQIQRIFIAIEFAPSGRNIVYLRYLTY